MSFACPNGHQSETADYCDQCGARIAGAPANIARPPAATDPSGTSTPPDPTAGPAPGGAGAGAGPELCPVCQTPRIGDDRFCEGCGHDYASPAPAQTTAPGPSDPEEGKASGTIGAPGWEAVATADRDYYERVAPEGVTFPVHCPPRTFLIAGDQIRIGRHSNSRGIQPEVDLAGAPEDSAISHLHCILIEQADGSYSLVDPGSTNGTTLNDDPTPLMANISVTLADGDRIHIGAWTTITIRARGPAEAGTAAP